MTRKKTSEWVFRNEKIHKLKGKKIADAVLRVRGIIKPTDVKAFLNPSIEDIQASGAIYNSDAAAKQIISALESNKTIFIHGDYDCDGICATAILWECLYKDAAQKVDSESKIVPYIPRRIDQGYGLSESSIDEMVQEGADLIITVDCGVRDKDLIKSSLKSNPNLEFIVTDHHLPPEDFTVSKNYTLVHQLHPKQKYLHSEICGSTIALLLSTTVMHKLGGSKRLSLDSPGLDLAALATITDLMPLTGINRTLVRSGIDLINRSPREGFKALINIAGIKEEINEYHLGYIIGPRINATGRIGDPLEALRLLLTSSSENSKKYASKINDLNSKRQEVTEEYFNFSLESINASSQAEQLNFVIGEDWHEGVIGLVANKLTEYYSRPSIVISKGDEIKGSARSIEGIHMTGLLEEFSDYLVKYGGHALAAGFTVKKNRFSKFKSEILAWADKNIDLESISRKLMIDLVLSIGEISKDEVKQLESLRPFGMKNQKPLFLLCGVVIKNVFTMGRFKNHVKLIVTDTSGKDLECVIFDCEEDIPFLKTGEIVDLVGTLSVNSWNSSETCQLAVKEWDISVS